MNLTTVDVPLKETPYQIQIGSGNLPQLGSLLAAHAPTKLFLIYDENVEMHFRKIESSLTADFECNSFKVPAGEKSKSIQQASSIWEFFAEKRADRKSMVVAIGGGVIGDLAGFIAATFARGIPFFQVPTTLLAHVDSSVGGKTGVNLGSAKNMVGSFWQPQGVLIDTQTLETLDDREYISGLAEVIKYGLIMDRSFFEKLESNATGIKNRDHQLLIDVIAHSCQLKAEVVVADERELSGRRAILNYGHTFAHAFETVFGYGKYLHGEAVSVGMLCAGRLAQKLGRVDEEFCRRQQALFSAVGLPISVKAAEPKPLLDVMRRDKKNVGNRIRFILPSEIGNVELLEEEIADAMIIESMTPYFE